MKRKKSNIQKLYEDIGSARKQITNENQALEYNVVEPTKDTFPKLISYIENQVDNLKDYSESLKKICNNNVCRSYLDAQTDELDEIKSILCKNLDVLYPPEEPSLNPTGYLTHWLKNSALILGDLMLRLNRTHILLESIHNGLNPK